MNKLLIKKFIIKFFMIILLFNNWLNHIKLFCSINRLIKPNIINKIPNENILNYEHFKISFNNTLNSMNYCIYTLKTNKSLCKSRFISNKIKFNKNMNMDNGHMIPKADIIDCSVNIRENIVAQYRNFNQGIWKELEQFIRKNYFSYTILTAPEYDFTNYIIINNSNIYIPIGFYKVVFNNNFDILYCIYLNHTNEKIKKIKISNFINNNNLYKLPYFINYNNTI